MAGSMLKFLALAVGTMSMPVKPDRIVGGQLVQSGDYPWLLTIGKKCGGALIRPDWFVTAAHCTVAVGEIIDLNRFDLGELEASAENFKVAEVHSHPDYNINDYVTDLHDIMLVRLSRPVQNTRPARLISPGEEALTRPGKMLTVAGWGAVTASDTEGRGVMQMRHAQVPVISNEVCNDAQHYGGANSKNVYESMLCAGYDQGGVDACVGDSGGPLFSMVGGQGVVVGVTSWAHGCAEPGHPGVYTSISAYRGWIDATLGGSSHVARPVPMPQPVKQQPAPAYQPAQSYPQPAQPNQQPTQSYPQPTQSYPQSTQSYPQSTQSYPQPANVYSYQQPGSDYYGSNRQPGDYGYGYTYGY